MGIHIDLDKSDKIWESFYESLFEKFCDIISLFKQLDLLSKVGDFTIWKNHPIEAMGGIQLLHMPLLANNWSSVLTKIDTVIKTEFNIIQDNVPSYLRKTIPVAFRIEGNLNFRLEDNELHPIPFDILYSPFDKKLDGQINIIIHEYLNHTFEDYFTGKHEYQRDNRSKLNDFVNELKKDLVIAKIIVGDYLNNYQNLLYNNRIYYKDEGKFLRELFHSVKFIEDVDSITINLGGLQEKDIQTLTTDISYLNLKYLTDQINGLKTYQTSLPEFWKAKGLNLAHGSIDIVQNEFQILSEYLGVFLKGISSSLQELIEPKEEFTQKFSEKLNQHLHDLILNSKT